jgi:hypothetical protein
MQAWIEAVEQAARDFVVSVLDLIEWAWKKAIAPRDE